MKRKMLKVLCPVERDGRTFWLRAGVGFPNKDGSTNIYLDCLPTNGKLQVREMDEQRDRDDNRMQPSLAAAAAADTPF